jgi:hypothetical protein
MTGPHSSAKPSRLIIRDLILPDTGAPLFAACQDMLMMVLLAGMERTERQWTQLLADVGLEVVGFWNAVKGGEGIIEAVKRGPVEDRYFNGTENHLNG